ncbi:MAG: alpha amylase N-terminal ig-like domain-containing protein [Thermoflexales bacterium]|nr:alpha amylase N-terminal ig-like domain-containing protein [Thermoflexales bacterium]
MKHPQFVRALCAVVLAASTFASAASRALPAAASPALLPGAPLAATSITLAGDLQSELGCPGDWQPACATTHLTYNAGFDVWTGSFAVPTGLFHYKLALNDSWTEAYGQNGGAGDITLNIAPTTTVKFYFDEKTHWPADNKNQRIVVAAGDFQSEAGCPGDWQPGCLRTWLQDKDGDGTYLASTTALPAGSYQFKVALGEGWTENYGAGGVAGGANIPFTVPYANAPVTFKFVSATNTPSVLVGHNPDGNVEYDGLGHDSQDGLYRVPFGAVTIGTTVTVRFRTFANDVTGVTARVWNTAVNAESMIPLTRVASNEDCRVAALATDRCDYWQMQLHPTQRGVLYYRFIIVDGASTAYYADDGMFDGGWGTATPDMLDRSYPIVVYEPDFAPIGWLQNGVMYQIFPDRFRNGSVANDPHNGDARYDDPVVKWPWGTLPEGYCRNYTNALSICPWRTTPIPVWGTSLPETPRGRDYQGGDLAGVRAKLDYLQDLGVTVIYFNPIFDSGSNHGYDTQNYLAIDPYFGSKADWDALVADADARGIKIILDGVFNHVSSDSKYFDRYAHYPEVGACESVASPYRSWFTFHDVAAGAGSCAGSAGPNSATYDGWFGFDSIPVMNKNNAAVRDLVYAGAGNVAAYWLNEGAAGWRLDVMSDGSFPADFWQGFRQTVKATNQNAPIIGEMWKRDEMLPKVQGDQADTGMNYRFRNAILGFYGTVDGKGFPDDGATNQPPSTFAKKMNSVREDYPDAAYYTLMNLMDSHDTMRILWNLTPAASNTRTDKENPANLAAGTELLKLAVLTQMGVPGVPTIYYGDEIGMTGEDDPDDRRAFPWYDAYTVYLPIVFRSGTGNASPDSASAAAVFGAGGNGALREYYKALIGARRAHPAFSQGALSFPLTDDANRTLVMMARTITDTGLVAINRDAVTHTLTFTATGRIPDGLVVSNALDSAQRFTATGGVMSLTLGPRAGLMLVAVAGQDQSGPTPVADLMAAPLNGGVALNASSIADAVGYAFYRSPVMGGGYLRIGVSATPAYTDSVANGKRYYYVMRGIDAAGNEGAPSNEASAVPAYPIVWANLQWPKTLTTTVGVTPTQNIYGQVYVPGLTNAGGPSTGILAQLGFGPTGSAPATWTTWKAMAYNGPAGSNYEYVTTLRPENAGVYDLLTRYSTDLGLTWTYGDQNGMGVATPGVMTVLANADNTPPAAPTLTLDGVGASQVRLSWTSVADAAEYRLYRRTDANPYGSPLLVLTTTSAIDTAVTTGTPYSYVVRAVDAALNLSADSNEIAAIPTPQVVSVTFQVTVPAGTPVTGTVYIVGNQPQICGWCNPHTTALTKTGPTTWSTTLTFAEGSTVEYKYTLGDWLYVQKSDTCAEVGNNVVNVGAGPTQVANDTVLNWRNVAPCGN